MKRRSPPPSFLKNKSTASAVLLSLVDPGGVEPPSENRSTELSPGADYLLKFPHRNADSQAFRFGIPLCSDVTGSHHVGIDHCVTPYPRPWCSAVGRRLIKPRKRDFRLRLILSFGYYRGPALCPLILLPSPRRNLYEPLSIENVPSWLCQCHALRHVLPCPHVCRKVSCLGKDRAAF